MLALEDRELIRWCGEAGHRRRVATRRSASGFLTGRYTASDAERIDDWRSGEAMDARRRARRVFAWSTGSGPIAERLRRHDGRSWRSPGTSHQPGVTARDRGQPQRRSTSAQNAAAGDLELDAATLAEIEALLGGLASSASRRWTSRIRRTIPSRSLRVSRGSSRSSVDERVAEQPQRRASASRP